MNVRICALAFLTKVPLCLSWERLSWAILKRQNEALYFAAVKFFEMSNIVTDYFSFDQVLM